MIMHHISDEENTIMYILMHYFLKNDTTVRAVAMQEVRNWRLQFETPFSTLQGLNEA